MNKHIIFFLATLPVTNVIAADQEFTPEYIQLRSELLHESRIPFDRCNKKATYEFYRKTYETCLTENVSEKRVQQCKRKTEKKIAIARQEMDPANHCNILKPTNEQFLNKLDNIASQKNISKFKPSPVN